MNFFARQKTERRHAFWLEVAFVLAVGLYVAIIDFVVNWLYHLLHAGRAWLSTSGLVWLSVWVTATVVGFSTWRMLQLREGGDAIAMNMGATSIDPDKPGEKYRMLVNVVEEMGVASRVPVPAVYVLEGERGINAFAAGINPSDAVICVTHGCIDRLSRDELQAVAAHQFSQILNGSMRTNIRMIGLLFGISWLRDFGHWALDLVVAGDYRSGPYPGTSNLRGVGAYGVLAVFGLMFGLVAVVLGYIGSLLARIVQAAAVRSSIQLADAAALQFTRNDAGIIGALKSMAAMMGGSRLNIPHRHEAAHIMFGNPLRPFLLATHPSIARRVRALGGTWSKTEIRLLAKKLMQHGGRRSNPAPAFATEAEQPADPSDDGFVTRAAGTATVAAALTGAAGVAASTPRSKPTSAASSPTVANRDTTADASGRTTATTAKASQQPSDTTRHGGRAPLARTVLQHTIDELDSLPAALRAATRKPGSATALLATLTLDEADGKLRARQLALITDRLGPAITRLARKLRPLVAQLPPHQRLRLALLAFRGLRKLPRETLNKLSATVGAIVRADQKVTLYEFCLQHLIKALAAEQRHRTRNGVLRHRSLRQSRDAVATSFAIMARQAGGMDEATTRSAWQAAMQHTLPRINLPMPTIEDWQQTISGALTTLARLDAGGKQRLVEGSALLIKADDRVTTRESALLDLICTMLRCPIPALDGISRSHAGGPHKASTKPAADHTQPA